MIEANLEKKELLGKVYWLIWVRNVALGLCFTFGVIGSIAAQNLSAVILGLGLGIFIALYNLGGHLYLKKNEKDLDEKKILNICFVQIVADVLATTILVYTTGGILSIFVLLYMLSIVTISMINPFAPHLIQGTALAIIIFYELMLLFGYHGILPPITIIQQGMEIYQDINLVFYFLSVFPISIIITIFLVSNLSKHLIAGKEALQTRIKELDVVRGKLEKAQNLTLKMVEHLKKDVEKLKEMDRMKSEFLSIVSHELRTPLTPIKGYISVLLDGKLGNLSPELKEALIILDRQSTHLQDLIEGVLDISLFELKRPIPIHKEDIKIKQLIKDCLNSHKLSAKNHQQKLALELDPGLPQIKADKIKLKRVLSNLISNAVKFTPEGGLIKIKAGQDNKNLIIEVNDNGIGLSKEQLDKIFEKFYQVDSSYTRTAGGIGMGLTLARELVKLHGGVFWVESAGLGHGCKFSFTLPI